MTRPPHHGRGIHVDSVALGSVTVLVSHLLLAVDIGQSDFHIRSKCPTIGLPSPVVTPAEPIPDRLGHCLNQSAGFW